MPEAVRLRSPRSTCGLSSGSSKVSAPQGRRWQRASKPRYVLKMSVTLRFPANSNHHNGPFVLTCMDQNRRRRAEVPNFHESNTMFCPSKPREENGVLNKANIRRIQAMLRVTAEQEVPSTHVVDDNKGKDAEEQKISSLSRRSDSNDGVSCANITIVLQTLHFQPQRGGG